ncbi:nuclear transport factor 2 family protein [Cellulomonas sp. C5510]|uniref:nuclear transport factor 2 family protein n=1 Tax=Cellulomonas sp. C5510 TaxID=2871170 RepID=UPI001C95BF21|nr:nuclear transport factor 2 family protein [Cellulomonas sp. C5510]QZN85169.1 nuclear transport factor 2 family protein [Cellulomonas sp. C5510]
MTTPTSTRPEDLPAAVRAFLAAQSACDAEAAVRVSTPGAVVVDDGTTYRGSDGVRRFLTRAGSEFTYTTTLVGAERVDDARWVVTHRLEGDFPGGVVDLRYRFALEGGLVAELVIAP